MKFISVALSIASAIRASGQLLSSGGKQKLRLRSLSDEAVGDSPLDFMDSMSMSMAANMAGAGSKSGKSSKSMKPVTAAAPIPLAPYCPDPGASCSSGMLLEGVNVFERYTYSDTIDGCPDGLQGIPGIDESVESITVTAVDGGELQAGKEAKIEAVVHAYTNYQFDVGLFWYSETVSTQFEPEWQFLGVQFATAPGLQTIEMPFVPSASGIQAIRVTFGLLPGYTGSFPIRAVPCPDGFFQPTDDNDDLVITVAEGSNDGTSISSNVEDIAAYTLDVAEFGSVCESLNKDRCAMADFACVSVDESCLPKEEV